MMRFVKRIKAGARNRMWLYLPGAAVFLIALAKSVLHTA